MQRPSRPKFVVQQKVMDFHSKIDRVLVETTCDRHSAPIGEPCWDVASDTTKFFGRGICGKRASKIYTGTVTDRSRSGKRPQKERAA